MDFISFKGKYNYNKATPVMQQYLDLKFNHQECLLLFRMGDFYELFYEDAIVASKVLSIALTKRGKTEAEEILMCGVPFHALGNYMNKLLEDGFKVAICDQMETPEEAKKRGGSKAVVARGVTRIITPGTIFEESLLEAAEPNYLASIAIDKEKTSICAVDISTSEISVVTLPLESLTNELSRIKPNEILLSEKYRQSDITSFVGSSLDIVISFQVDSFFAASKCEKVIENFYNIASIGAIGNLTKLEISAIGSILEYISITQKEHCPKLSLPKIDLYDKYMSIDSGTLKNLEILSSNSTQKSSLKKVIDHTITKSGSRLLHKYLSRPLLDIDRINDRLNKVEFFYNNISLTEVIRSSLKKTSDLERCISRLNMNRGTPHDLLGIKNTIKAAEVIFSQISKIFGESAVDYIKSLIAPLIDNNEIHDLIDSAVNEEAPNSANNGEIIKHSFHPKVKELYDLLENGKSAINSLRDKYKRLSGIDNLKVSHNNILGLFIEVTIRNINKMTDEVFIHRQSTANFARYSSVELKELEMEMTNAKQRVISLEKEIYDGICQVVAKDNKKLVRLASALSHIDLYSSMAYLAESKDYTRPSIVNDQSFEIVGGRHPIIEKSMEKDSQSFISNNCNMSIDERIWLITGPNMAGKSTFLRQNAIIAILSQAGFFVPAERAKIGISDKIFSRIGAGDDLSRGQSTFMVEMLETASILSQSTSKSLIILDEVGRGTSTFDGLAIAWSVLEHIHDKIRARCLFATHYHELTKMIDILPSASCYTIAIEENEQNIIFLHKIIKGAADKSYGVHVAKLAGLPKSVLKKAEDLLKKLEKDNAKLQNNILKTQDINLNLFDMNIDNIDQDHSIYKNNNTENQSLANNKVNIQNAQDAEKYRALLAKINIINPDKLSPRDALNALYEIKDMQK